MFSLQCFNGENPHTGLVTGRNYRLQTVGTATKTSQSRNLVAPVVSQQVFIKL